MTSPVESSPSVLAYEPKIEKDEKKSAVVTVAGSKFKGRRPCELTHISLTPKRKTIVLESPMTPLSIGTAQFPSDQEPSR